MSTPTPPSPPLPIPERVGPYEILAPIASGGMATVYLARARGLGGFEREVAVKLTHPHLAESPELSAVLLEEAKLAVRIRHSNVVSVLDVGDDGGVFLVMEYVEGDALVGLTRGGSLAGLPRPIAMRILLDALAGLHAAHELRDDRGEPVGVVHRDFSPHNILVGTDGVAKLTDFGIAKVATRAGHTGTGLVKGKISYMAPEQARGLALDRRCDVWAAGVIAWELLAGRRLYEKGDDGVPVLLKVISEEPPRLRDVAPDVSPELDAAVASALTLDPAARCPTAAQLARRLAEAFGATERIADASEVGELVTRHVGPKLEARRSRAHARLSTIDATDTVRSPPPDGATNTVFTARTHATPARADASRRRAWWWTAAAIGLVAATGVSILARGPRADAPGAGVAAAVTPSPSASSIAPAPKAESSAPTAAAIAPVRASTAPATRATKRAAHPAAAPEGSTSPPAAPGKLAPAPW